MSKIVFDKFLFSLRSEEREEAAACLSEGWRCHGTEWSYQQRDKEDFPESVRSLMRIRNNMGLRTLSWGYFGLDRERK